MGRLINLLKNSDIVNESKINRSIRKNHPKKDLIKNKLDTIGFSLTDEEYTQVLESVEDIDSTNKSREDIIVAKYYNINDPRTGKKFIIPNLIIEDGNYIYKYANFMRMLVKKPTDFYAIMNWE